MARQRLASEPDGARIAIVEGDLLKDDLPSGHDLSSPLISFMAYRTPIILGCCATCALMLASAAADVGRVPHSFRRGQAYGEDDADRWLSEIGWRKLDRRPLAGPASVIIAEAA